MGAESIKELLAEIDLDKLAAELKSVLENATGQKRVRYLKRLEVVEAFRSSGNRPIWPIRSRRTLERVTSTPHLSQILPLKRRRLYFPQ